MINRRHFLKSAGVALALPAFESALPRTPLRAAEDSVKAHAPMRMACISVDFGLYPREFFPEKPGPLDASTGLLKPFTKLKDRLTVFSNLEHPGVGSGHVGTHAFLTGIKSGDARAADEPMISLDQLAAESVGNQTRFPSLTLAVTRAGGKLAWARGGIGVPPEVDPCRLFDALFTDLNPASSKRAARRMKVCASVLDVVLDDAKSFNKSLCKRDQQKFDEYLTSVRSVEKRLEQSQEWVDRPKPDVNLKRPVSPFTFFKRMELLYDLQALAFQTDSTRVSTLLIPGALSAQDLGVDGVTTGYHALTHHGKDPSLIEMLMKVERLHVEQAARFLSKLASTTDVDGRPLLDNTMVFFGGALGNGSSHSGRCLPVLLAGGGFKHGNHLVFSDDREKITPLSNLYLSMLNRFGVETDRFSDSKGTLTGLDVSA